MAVWLRWAWRQLTSMRVALLLLLLLAVVAVPGSLLPQRGDNAAGVATFLTDHPALGAVLDVLGFFSVYSSPWFMAVYTLLFVSLIGCIIPRIRQHAAALRAAPPDVPSRLVRFPAHRVVEVDLPPAEVYERVERNLRPYRHRRTERGITAERGYLRETGNIVFHVALIGVLLSFGYGQLATYRGQAVVVEGESFANSVLDYDSFQAGALVDEAALDPFSFRLDSLVAEFSAEGRPEAFQANVTIGEGGGVSETAEIAPNEPWRSAGGTAVYLSGNGYAPVVEVRDADGNLAFSGAVPFLPQDDVYTSDGVIKVPDVTSGPQLGFSGQLLPTAWDDGSGLRSVHPSPGQPLLLLQMWTGDLGLDDGVPQNVYRLDTAAMEQVLGDDGAPALLALTPGATVDLPDGLGTLTFVELRRFASLDLRHDPSLQWLLWTSLATMAGLMGSLFVPRRRLWVTAEERDGRTVVEAAALARGEDAGLERALDDAMKDVG